MGGCQIYGPFLGTRNIRCRAIIGIQKGTIILTTTHIGPICEQLGYLEGILGGSTSGLKAQGLGLMRMYRFKAWGCSMFSSQFAYPSLTTQNTIVLACWRVKELAAMLRYLLFVLMSHSSIFIFK